MLLMWACLKNGHSSANAEDLEKKITVRGEHRLLRKTINAMSQMSKSARAKREPCCSMSSRRGPTFFPISMVMVWSVSAASSTVKRFSLRVAGLRVVSHS